VLRRIICKLGNVEHIKSGRIPADALQGVIMENIDEGFAERLHLQGLNPYSQYVESRRDGRYWVIQTLTQEAGKQIIDPLLSPAFLSFHLNRIGKDISILEKTQSETHIKELIDNFYFGQSERIFRMRFLTPTAFKSKGEYIFYPNLRLLYGSLMRKYAAVCENEAEQDEDTLESLVENTMIVRYDLKSVYNEIGRSRLPAFCGMIVIKATGSQQLVNYLHFLLRFGEYSGVGIKSAMGMGAIKIFEKPGLYHSTET